MDIRKTSVCNFTIQDKLYRITVVSEIGIRVDQNPRVDIVKADAESYGLPMSFSDLRYIVSVVEKLIRGDL